MHIREYTNKDFPFIAEIYGGSKLDELTNEESNFSLIPLEEDSRRLSTLMASEIYVYDNNGIMGYGAHKGHEITALFVAPKHRKKGIGVALFKYLLTKTSSQAYLYVAKSNDVAVSLYESYGFEKDEEFQAEYNGIPVQAMKMKKQ